MSNDLECLRTEINLNRLLDKCELRGRDHTGDSDWRLEKYVEAAKAMLLTLTKNNHSLPQSKLHEYTRRIDFLKKLIESQKVKTPNEKLVAVQFIPNRVNTSSENLTKEIRQKACSKLNGDIRAQLFGADAKSLQNEGTSRRRNDIKTSGEDLDSILKHHQSMQERAAEDMLMLTKSLKEQTKLAGDIIRKDLQTVSKASNRMELNQGKLGQASNVLGEFNRRSGKCGQMVLLVIILVVFLRVKVHVSGNYASLEDITMGVDAIDPRLYLVVNEYRIDTWGGKYDYLQRLRSN